MESYRRSGRDVGENLIAETSACPLTTRVPLTLEGWCRDKGRLPLPIIIPNHPLDKIFGDMTARLTEFTHVSVRHYFTFHLSIFERHRSDAGGYCRSGCARIDSCVRNSH